jgi:exosortase
MKSLKDLIARFGGMKLPENVHPLTWVAYLAFCALFVPTFYKLFTYGWDYADYSHGPLILAAFFWLIWRERTFLSTVPDRQNSIFSLPLLFFGLLCYTGSAILGSMVSESFAMIPVFLGMTGLLLGKQAMKRMLFPACFLIFLVPPPGFFIDMITAPLQMLVTVASAGLLKFVGYTVHRDGVILHIADYTIIVGAPCSGLRSLISLMAVGALYTYLQKMSNIKRAILFCSILPITIFANIIRLVVLALITYYFGEAAGQGFFHDFSGFVLFIIAMISLVLFDALLDRISRRGSRE